MKPWTIAAVAVATLLFAIALSGAAYELTSPTWLSFHVLLRKTYSVGAFALVAYLLRRAVREWSVRAPVAPLCIGGVAAYSAAIEGAQALLGSHEGLAWNAFDVACGALGGTIAVADRLVAARPAA